MSDKERAFKIIKRYKEYIIANDFNSFYKKVNETTKTHQETGVITQVFIDAGVIDDVVQNLTTIPSSMFWETNIGNLNLPNNITKIGDGAFYGCVNLTDLVIPEGVRVIGDNAFAFSGLKTVTIPGSVPVLGSTFYFSSPISSPFYGCSCLKNVTLPARFKGNIHEYFKNWDKINFTFI